MLDLALEHRLLLADVIRELDRLVDIELVLFDDRPMLDVENPIGDIFE